MARRRHNSSDYRRFREDRHEHEEVDGLIDEQFRERPRKFPWKAVFFIMSFFIVGAVCLTFGLLTFTGYFDEKYADRCWPLLILGVLMFIPGGYYAYILLSICLKRDGFTIENVPMF